MLSRSFRISKEKDINRFFCWQFRKIGGNSASSKFLIIKSLPAKNIFSRFGFIVNTKVDNRASVRNLVKRRLREIVRLNMNKIKVPRDILILALPPAKMQNYQTLEKDFLLLLKRLELI